MTEPIIAGIGESEFCRRSSRPFTELQLTAIEAALSDAGLSRSDVDSVYTDSEVMPELFPIDDLPWIAGLSNVRATGMFSLGGSGIAQATAFAADRIRNGDSSVALIYFGVDWGSSTAGPYGYHDRYASKSAFEKPYGFYGQPTYMAAMARRYAHEYGVSMDQLKGALGQLAVDQRANALANPASQMRTELSLEEYHSSRIISSPLGKYDCCLLTDGAAAFIVADRSMKRSKSRKSEAAIIGTGYGASLRNEEDYFTQNPHYPRIDPASTSSREAFKNAGIVPSDLDFVEFYDCFTILTVLQAEEVGLCGPGQGWKLVAEGTAVGSDAPVALNTHGGCLSHAYLLGITHITEAARQLRGEGGDGQVAGAELGAVAMAPGHDHSTLVLATV